MDQKYKINLQLTARQPFYVSRSFRPGPFPVQRAPVPVNFKTSCRFLEKTHEKENFSQNNFNSLQQRQSNCIKQWKKQHRDLLKTHRLKSEQQIEKKVHLLLQQKLAMTSRLKIKFQQLRAIKKNAYDQYRHKCKNRYDSKCQLCQKIYIGILNQAQDKTINKKIKHFQTTQLEKAKNLGIENQNSSSVQKKINKRQKPKHRKSIQYTQATKIRKPQQQLQNSSISLRKKIQASYIQQQDEGYNSNVIMNITNRQNTVRSNLKKISKLGSAKHVKQEQENSKQDKSTGRHAQGNKKVKRSKNVNFRNSIKQTTRISREVSKKNRFTVMQESRTQANNRQQFDTQKYEQAGFIKQQANTQAIMKEMNLEKLDSIWQTQLIQQSIRKIKSKSKLNLSELRIQENRINIKGRNKVIQFENTKKEKRIGFQQSQRQLKSVNKKRIMQLISKSSGILSQTRRQIKQKISVKHLTRKNLISRNKIGKRTQGINRIKGRASIQQVVYSQSSDRAVNQNNSLSSKTFSSEFSRLSKRSKKKQCLGFSRYQQEKLIFNTFLKTGSRQNKRGIFKLKTKNLCQIIAQKQKQSIQSLKAQQNSQDKLYVDIYQQQLKNIRFKQLLKCKRKKLNNFEKKKVNYQFKELKKKQKKKFLSSKEFNDSLDAKRTVYIGKPLYQIKRDIQKYLQRKNKLLQQTQIISFYEHIQDFSSKRRVRHEQKYNRTVIKSSADDKQEIGKMAQILNLLFQQTKDTNEQRKPMFQYFDIDLQMTQTFDPRKREVRIDFQISNKQNKRIIYQQQTLQTIQDKIGQKPMERIAKSYLIQERKDCQQYINL